MSIAPNKPLPSRIGVFDSGVGGLTVVASLQRLLPAERIFYIGDTARLPYGEKSATSVNRYSREIVDILLQEGAKLIVVACNTASALGFPKLATDYQVPMIGALEPSAVASVKATNRFGRIGVIGTHATISSGSYRRAIMAINPDVFVTSIPCPLLVPLIEHGLLKAPITNFVLSRYLKPMLKLKIDTLVLGCTHYSLLKDTILKICGDQVKIIDSSESCALAVKDLLGASESTEASLGLDILLSESSKEFLSIAERSLDLKIKSLKICKIGDP